MDNQSQFSSGSGMNGNSEMSSSSNQTSSGGGNFLEQLKLCIPSVSEFQAALMSGFNTLQSLISNPLSALSNSASETSSWTTQLRTYLLPLVTVGVLARFIKGSFIGQSLPMLGEWKEPVVSGFIYHAMSGIGMLACYCLVAWAVTKVLPLNDGQSNILSLQKTIATPSLFSQFFVVLGAIGTLVGLVGGVFSLYLLWNGSKVVAERNPQVTALKFLGVTLLAGLLFGVIFFVLISPLMPVNLTVRPQL